MASKTYINIRYPFQDSVNGFFVELNNLDKDAIKSDLMHLVLTRKGERLYNPDFGTNLLSYFFEPNDSYTLNSIKEDITNAIKKYLSKLVVNSINVTQSSDNDYLATIRIEYTVTDDVFNTTDFVVINL